MKECKYCGLKDYELQEAKQKLIHTIWDSLVCEECVQDLQLENGGVDLPI